MDFGQGQLYWLNLIAYIFLSIYWSPFFKSLERLLTFQKGDMPKHCFNSLSFWTYSSCYSAQIKSVRECDSIITYRYPKLLLTEFSRRLRIRFVLPLHWMQMSGISMINKYFINWGQIFLISICCWWTKILVRSLFFLKNKSLMN